MEIEKNQIEKHNQQLLPEHKRRFDFASDGIRQIDQVLKKLIDFQIAIPSWALGTGGTRFGRFSGGGEPSNLEEKIERYWIASFLEPVQWCDLPSYSLGYS